MFKQLVESGSHRADLARRSTFFIGTMGLYAVLLACLSVASVFAYNAQLDNQNYEVLTLVSPPPLPAAPPRTAEPRPASGGQTEAAIERADLISRYTDNVKPPDTISVTPNKLAELPKYGPLLLTGRDSGDVLSGGPAGPPMPGQMPTTDRPRVVLSDDVDVAPPVRPAPTPTPVRDRIRLTSQVLSGKVLSKPVPSYPLIAKQARVFGVVTVEILTDEQGRVVSAQVTSGHPLLREAARAAAMQARFSPTYLAGQPVKVSGVITYNFILQ